MLKAAHSAVLQKDWATAFQLSNKHLNEHPESAEGLYLLGATLRALGNMGAALPILSKALRLAPTQPNLWMTYAACLHDLNQWEDAEKAFTKVNGMLPNDPMPVANIGATYVQRGKWAEAINWCDKALKLDPENHIARISKGFACLSLGRWKDAWQYSEALYGNHLDIRYYSTKHDEPEWDGTKGQTVVVQCDQGLGDQIMFAQCLPQLQADCKQVIVECQKRMEPFFKRNFPGIHVYGTAKDEEQGWSDGYEIDARIHISLLGKFYRRLDRDFPRSAYISARPESKAKWLEWLAQFPKPWTGIAWRGGIQATQTHIRSVELEDFSPIVSLPGTHFDLSYHDSRIEVSRWNIKFAPKIVKPELDIEDYEDTIAFVAALDEVVSVTTSIVHVCGALGRSCQVLVPDVAQWRYAYRYQGGENLIWYPDSVRMYRQKPGETGWSHAVNRVVKAL